jgi:hypothetical protein
MERQAAYVTNAVIRLVAVSLILTAIAGAQNAEPQLVLENDFVRVSRVTIPAKQDFSIVTKNDTVAVRLQDDSARFIPKGDRVAESNTTDNDAVELLVEVKKHWEAEVHPCAFPKTCTHETRMGTEPIAWTTTLFTNGFLTATTHKVVQGGTLTSSYYTSKGSDKIVLVPFTDLDVNFSGIEESLKAGQPYFGEGTEVEVTGKQGGSRWFVLRFSATEKK